MARPFQTYEARRAARARAMQWQAFLSLSQSAAMGAAILAAFGAAAFALYQLASLAAAPFAAASLILKGLQP